MNLFREIHQRSMWQVFGIYLGASWVMLQIVDTLAGALGLPDWSASFALFLLIIGLPIVLATAFLQGGMSTAKPEPEPQSLSDVGEVPPAPATEVTGARRFLTWRRALLGGGAAFALLGVLTAVYLFMRTAGIGPAGTLVAQGTLEEGAEVLLADFDGNDPELAEVVTGALRIDLVQSPTLRVIPRAELARALRRMQRDEDEQLSGAVARELAEREGYGAIIEGAVGVVGSGYVLTASIVGVQRGEPLAAFRTTAKSEDQLIEAIEELSRDIRDKAGESLRSLNQTPGLEHVSTTSLEALRHYTSAQDLEATDMPAAVELYELAAALDPDFAMAHRKVAVNLGNVGTRRRDQVAAARRAFELRDRLPTAEGFLAEAYYYNAVVGDVQAAMRAYERLLEVDPDDRGGLNNLALNYMFADRWVDARDMLEHALSVEPFRVGVTNLANTWAGLGQLEEMDAVLDEWSSRLPESAFDFEQRRAEIRLSAGHYAEAEALASAYGERFPSRDGQKRHAHLEARVHGVRGQLREADDRLAELAGGQFPEAHPMWVARDRATLRLVRGDSVGAIGLLVTAYEIHRDTLPITDRRYNRWLPLLVEAGGTVEAAPIYEEWRREVREDELGGGNRLARREIDARLAFAEGRLDEAERLWDEYRSACPGGCALLPSQGLGQIHEARGNTPAAIAEYERYMADPWPIRWRQDPGRRALVLERLGMLYEEQGDLENAEKFYAMFVELWADADEELQPRVRAAQARLEEIVRARG